MGTAPGIKADFYEQMNMDFCADLKNWTTILLADSDSPKVCPATSVHRAQSVLVWECLLSVPG